MCNGVSQLTYVAQSSPSGSGIPNKLSMRSAQSHLKAPCHTVYACDVLQA